MIALYEAWTRETAQGGELRARRQRAGAPRVLCCRSGSLTLSQRTAIPDDVVRKAGARLARQVGVLGVLAALAVLAAPAGAQHKRIATVSLSGSVQPGPGDSATLSLTNAGPDGLLFWRVVPPQGKSFDTVSASGVQCQIFNGQAGCGPYNPPLPANQSLQAVLHSPQGLSAADGSLQVFGTSDGRTDDGPFLVAWQQVAKPCKCVKLAVSMKATDVYTASAQLLPEGDALARLGGLVSWAITCSAGVGGCAGSITLLPAVKSDFKAKLFAPLGFVPKTGPYKGKKLYRRGKPMKLSFACAGPCNTTTIGRFFLQIDSNHDLLPANRAGKTLILRFKIVCSGTSIQQLRFVFKANGDLNRAKSTLTK